jgi:hypothetical protein
LFRSREAYENSVGVGSKIGISSNIQHVRLAGGWWLICFERKVLLTGCCWFVLREQYCWLVADKPNKQDAR